MSRDLVPSVLVDRMVAGPYVLAEQGEDLKRWWRTIGSEAAAIGGEAAIEYEHGKAVVHRGRWSKRIANLKSRSRLE